MECDRTGRPHQRQHRLDRLRQQRQHLRRLRHGEPELVGIGLLGNLQDTRGLPNAAQSYKTYQTADWVVGWEFLGKTALTLPCTGSERDSTRQPRYGGHTFECGLRRSELVSVTVKTIQQRQAPWSGSPRKED